MKNSLSLITHMTALLFFGIGILSCSKDSLSPRNPNQINFQSPVTGQQNYYLRYNGDCGDLQPTGDTLILRVKDFNGEVLLFEESFAKGSANYVQYQYEFPSKWNPDMIEIKTEDRQGSLLFNFYGSDFLKLTQPPVQKMDQSGCLLFDGIVSFRGDKIGYVSLFQVGNQKYVRKKVVSCVPTFIDLDAYLVYDNRNLYSSFSMSKWEFWDNVSQNVNAYALIDLDQ